MAFDRRETALLIIGDFFVFILSLWVALSIRNLAFPSFSYFEHNLWPFVPMFLLSLVVFYISGLYEKQTRPIRRVMGARILGAQIANVVIAAFLFFILPLTIAPKTILALYLIVSVIATSAWRFYRMRRELAESARTPALLVGTGPAATELFEEVNNNSRYLIRFVDDPGSAEIVMRDVSALYEEVFDRVALEHLGTHGIESASYERALYDLAKRMFDIFLAAIGSILSAPFVLLAALALLFQGGPVFIFSNRIGRGGRTFNIIKLRTMLFNDEGDPELQKKNRVTGLGKFLRRTRIDELPQLWNVFAGDLSFIGPRPELPKIAEVYEREIPYYGMRHLIAPGLSGWAQIHDYDAPRGGADVERTRRKLSFDLYYLKHRSFGLDFAISLKSIRALLSFSGT